MEQSPAAGRFGQFGDGLDGTEHSSRQFCMVRRWMELVGWMERNGAQQQADLDGLEMDGSRWMGRNGPRTATGRFGHGTEWL